MRLRVWGVPPGRGGKARQASRHNTTFEGGLTAGGGVTTGAGAGLATALGVGLGGAVGLDMGDGLGSAADIFEQAAIVATARPAVPARCRSRRRLSPGPPLGPSGGDVSISVTIRNPGRLHHFSCGITSAARRSICSRSSATLVPTGLSRIIWAPASMTSRRPRTTSSGVPDTGTASMPGISP